MEGTAYEPGLPSRSRPPIRNPRSRPVTDSGRFRPASRAASIPHRALFLQPPHPPAHVAAVLREEPPGLPAPLRLAEVFEQRVDERRRAFASPEDRQSARAMRRDDEARSSPRRPSEPDPGQRAEVLRPVEEHESARGQPPK